MLESVSTKDPMGASTDRPKYWCATLCHLVGGRYGRRPLAEG